MIELNNFGLTDDEIAALSKVDRLGLAFCRFCIYEWDSFIGPKPEGFDDLPECDEYSSKRIHHPIKMTLLSKIFPQKYAKRKNKQDLIEPVMKAFRMEIGDANMNRCWWKYVLHKSEEEWRRWYYLGKF
ncbi:MAG: hypothetical protein HFF14_05840 [Angelakisella sp.]|jgi:hypothetical protein|nr:hypothetical protein [Angelakisella sp.]